MAEYTLTLDDNDLAALNLAIGEMPHRLAVPLVAKINAQTATQRPPADADPHDHMKRGTTGDDQPDT